MELSLEGTQHCLSEPGEKMASEWHLRGKPLSVIQRVNHVSGGVKYVSVTGARVAGLVCWDHWR